MDSKRESTLETKFLPAALILLPKYTPLRFSVNRRNKKPALSGWKLGCHYFGIFSTSTTRPLMTKLSSGVRKIG